VDSAGGRRALGWLHRASPGAVGQDRALRRPL